MKNSVFKNKKGNIVDSLSDYIKKNNFSPQKFEVDSGLSQSYFYAVKNKKPTVFHETSYFVCVSHSIFRQRKWTQLWFRQDIPLVLIFILEKMRCASWRNIFRKKSQNRRLATKSNYFIFQKSIITKH